MNGLDGGPQEKKIGMIGVSSSGKTTFLKHLRDAVNQDRGPKNNWIFQGKNQYTNEWLIENKDNYFPVPTLNSPKDLEFSLFGNGVEALISVQDLPGINYKENNIATFKYLLDCRGYIFLISPYPEETRISDVLENLLSRLNIQYGNGQAVPLFFNKRVSVCLSQYDDSGFFHWLKERNYLEARRFNGIENTPVISRYNVINAFLNWEEFSDGKDIIHLFKTYFNPRYVDFFAVSSIGFYRKPDSMRIDWDDCGNVAETPRGRVIRMGRSCMPVRLFQPINWLYMNNDCKSDWVDKFPDI